MRQYTVAIAVKLVPVLKSLTSSQPHDTTSMVHAAGVAAAQYELARIYIDKEMGMLALLAVLIRILVANDG